MTDPAHITRTHEETPMTHQTVSPPAVPTLTTVEEATALLAQLAETYDWVSVFWDRGWGESPLEISIVVGGNGQDPKAHLTDEVYRALRSAGTIPPNTLKTFKSRRLHDYRRPPEREQTGPTANDVAEQVIRAVFDEHPDWPMHAEFYRGLDPDSDTPRTMYDHLYSAIYARSRGGVWHVLAHPGCREVCVSLQEPTALGPMTHGGAAAVDIVQYPRTPDGDVDLDALAGPDFRARLVESLRAKHELLQQALKEAQR